MATQVQCEHCGYSGPHPAFASTGTVTFKNVIAPCPRCRQPTQLTDGTYSFMGGALESFRLANLEQLERFRFVAEAAAAGELSPDEAQKQAAEVHAAFGRLIAFAREWGVLPLLVAVVSLYIAWAATQSSDRSEAAMIEGLKTANATNELVLKQLQQVTAEMSPSPQRNLHSAPKSSQQASGTAAQGNRHTRRKNKALPRRGPERS